jgi:hypothetical protein
MVAGVCGRGHSPHDRQEVQRNSNRKKPGQDLAPEHLLPPIRPHLLFLPPLRLSYYECIKTLIHSLGQSPQDLTVLEKPSQTHPVQICQASLDLINSTIKVNITSILKKRLQEQKRELFVGKAVN